MIGKIIFFIRNINKFIATSLACIKDKKVKDNKIHIESAISWLLKAQEKGKGGFSRQYSLYKGWDKPYPETTGYIIETMIKASSYLNKREYKDSAFLAGEWLLNIQNKNGSFSDVDGNPQAFDTAQVISGFISLYEISKDLKFLNASCKAGEWLVSIQEKDGSLFSYYGRKRGV